MQRQLPVEGECYHVYNRGVEKRVLFTSVADYERFLFVLFAGNTRRRLVNIARTYRGLPSAWEMRPLSEDMLVDLLCFCVLPNHFHLLLRQRVAEGIPLFMQKLGTAYTMYFNTRHDHSGVLLQGTYQTRHVDRDAYLLPVSRYIHLNALDPTDSSWRERGISDPAAAHAALLQYRWSSYAEYVGEPRYAPFISTDLLFGIFQTREAYAQYVTRSWHPGGVRELGKVSGDFLVSEVKPHSRSGSQTLGFALLQEKGERNLSS